MSTRGKHRIYLGMAPGVGKTYRMLQEANTLRKEGIDVVVGIVETHGRKETKQAIADLLLVPRQSVTRGNTKLTEMDTNAIIARKPQIVLVDELAHTNVPGSLRLKRYEDVEVILEAGIDVFSTLNVQHLDSLNDMVAKITGVIVRERVPDRLLSKADEIVFVDVTPETLQERLQDGKIYTPDKIQQSLQNFFQHRNLAALRELAMREVVNNLEEVEGIKEQRFSSVRERILVCVSTYPNSSQLLRRGARLASLLQGNLYAVYVANPDRFLSKDDALYIEICKQFCQDFGGEFIRVENSNIAEAIANVADEYAITQVVLGHSQKSRWQSLIKNSTIQSLMRQLQDVDLHIIAVEK